MNPLLFFSFVFAGLIFSLLSLNILWKVIYEDPTTFQLYDSFGAFSEDYYPGYRFSSVKKSCILVASISCVFSAVYFIFRAAVLLRFSVLAPAIVTILLFMMSGGHYDRLVRRCCYDGFSKKDNPPPGWVLHIFNLPFSVPVLYGIFLVVLSLFNFFEDSN